MSPPDEIPPDEIPIDDDNPEWTDAMFARARPADEVLPPGVLAQFRNTRQRGPQKAPKKVPVSLRLSPDVLKHFKQHRGWQSRIDAILKKAVEEEQREARKVS
jgi:uncharacterized protein (DUF4415 family)